MRALAYQGPGQRRREQAPAVQDPTDALVSIDTTAICGTGLHILEGDAREELGGVG
jgi:alcohol dehydrogenase